MVNNKSKKHSTKRYTDSTIARNIIIVVICLAIAAVGAAVACHFLLNDEKVTKDRTESLAREYYENYIYDGIVKNGMSQAEIEQAMEKYTIHGYANVNLRQLLLFDTSKSADIADLIRSRCDENTSFVKIYPEPPFNKKSYRLDFHYDCNF